MQNRCLRRLGDTAKNRKTVITSVLSRRIGAHCTGNPYPSNGQIRTNGIVTPWKRTPSGLASGLFVAQGIIDKYPR